MKIPPALLRTLAAAALIVPAAAQAEAVFPHSSTAPLQEGKPAPQLVDTQDGADVLGEDDAEEEECPKSSDPEVCPPRMDDCPGCGLG